MTKTVVPALLISFNMFRTAKPLSGSKFPVGSSATSKSGEFANALAIAPLCCSPPESCSGKVFFCLVI